jgi:Thiamine pyrophosphate enzyme, central domain
MSQGAGALQATDEVIKTADVLGAGVTKALLGRAALPDDLSFVTGQIGLLGTRPSWDMMQDCDTLLMIGSRFPYAEFLPKEGSARGVQIDIDPKVMSIRYPMEVNLVGDAAVRSTLSCPCLSASQINLGADLWRPRSPIGGRRKSSARTSKVTRSIQNVCFGKRHLGFQTTRSSPQTLAPRPVGLLGHLNFGAE